MKLKTVLFLFVLFITINSRAQLNPTFEIGLGIGGYIYQGDLAPDDWGSYKTVRPGINLFGSKILSSSISLRSNIAIAGLRGNDSRYNKPDWMKQRNFRFKTGLFELSQLIVWNPLKKNYDDRGFYPYLFAGAGVGFVKIKRDWSDFNSEYFNGTDVAALLIEDTEHSTPRVIPFIPAGVGLRLNLSSRWGANIESTYRILFTDYLDGFSVAANPEKKDKYHSVTVGAVYRIGKKNTLECPKVGY